MKGRFLALEGVDGVGKTTQVDSLVAALEDRGHTVVRVREPGGTPLGESVREILLHRTEVPITPEAEMLLFLACRVTLYDDVIAPALASGHMVVSDRFHLSTIVYQGHGRQLGEERVSAVCAAVLGDRRPDLSVILELDADTRRARMGSDGDRFENHGDLLDRVARGFETTQGIPGDRILRVGATGSVDEVASRVWDGVKGVFEW